ncbi:hypothetical protein D3260_03685 [Salinisphaera sp. Q1T1-3]|nr:hypothetical protein D3260_03685 [Salinisphaera sp. Q1T1-3]
MIARPSMYALPPIAALTDAWCQGLARHSGAAGLAHFLANLTRGVDLPAIRPAPIGCLALSVDACARFRGARIGPAPA